MKKFNLDGSNQWKCYRHDLKKDPQMFETRQAGGGSVMIWGAFLAKGVVDLHECDKRLNSEKYIKILKD